MAKNCIKEDKIVHKYTENGVFSVMPNRLHAKNAHFMGISGFFIIRDNTNYTELGTVRLNACGV